MNVAELIHVSIPEHVKNVAEGYISKITKSRLDAIEALQSQALKDKTEYEAVAVRDPRWFDQAFQSDRKAWKSDLGQVCFAILTSITTLTIASIAVLVWFAPNDFPLFFRLVMSICFFIGMGLFFTSLILHLKAPAFRLRKGYGITLGDQLCYGASTVVAAGSESVYLTHKDSVRRVHLDALSEARVEMNGDFTANLYLIDRTGLTTAHIEGLVLADAKQVAAVVNRHRPA